MSNQESGETAKGAIAKREEEILAFWERERIFEQSVEREPVHGEYVFYDGPPFATGLPHYGHMVASAIKDAVPRYWTMRGFRVKRQWGWDCHGLPIENIVEKEIGTRSKKDILTFGVKKFNDLCRERIFTYIKDWERIMPRIGRWADMQHPYRTMDTSFMESDWWAFKALYDKGLIYEDYRVMHICPRCETTLSQSEVAENYRDVKDLAVTAKFELAGHPGTYFLAWTTTPWTLPGNVALAVHPDIEYAQVKTDAGNFILAKARLEAVFGDTPYEIVDTRKGSECIGATYTPPFDYFNKDGSLKNRENGWKVYAADFVTADEGTGIVHIAPAFGEDDFLLSKKEHLPFVQHVGMDGVFTKDVTDPELAGKHVKPIDDEQSTDVLIIKYLAARGLLFAKEKYEHSYPHCWRCDTPLLNYATSSWFVAVTKVKPELLEYAKSINWSPAHIKEGRWGQWLEGARDWSISRQRFWATTIPIWRCADCKKVKVFGSIAELKEASGVEVTDLHKDVVDEVTFPCACGGVFTRNPDVLDTWFDSGSVPYAALHYPFENAAEFEERMPADFIAEGQDQTRTWFYYQHVLAGALFEKNAFTNVIVNGLVMAEDGKKMSKKLKNYPDPMDVVDRYGADALRLYLLSSPVVAAENLSFKEAGVDEIMKKVIMRLENVYALLSLYETPEKEAHDASAQVLDRWIIARTRELVREVNDGMETYQLDRATRPIMQFVDDLSTWYARRSRDRLKDMASADGKDARATLGFVLRTVAQVIAPLAPFMAESLWLRLRTDADAESVHLSAWPVLDAMIDTELLARMAEARAIVSAALEARDAAGIKVRQPLGKLTIAADLPEDVRQVIAEEVNVEYVVADARAKELVSLDTAITPALEEKGRARDLVRAIQDARKERGFGVMSGASVTVRGPAEWEAVIANHGEYVRAATRATELAYEAADAFSIEAVERA